MAFAFSWSAFVFFSCSYRFFVVSFYINTIVFYKTQLNLSELISYFKFGVKFGAKFPQVQRGTWELSSELEVPRKFISSEGDLSELVVTSNHFKLFQVTSSLPLSTCKFTSTREPSSGGGGGGGGVCVCVWLKAEERSSKPTNARQSSSPRAVEFPPRVCQRDASGAVPSCERPLPLRAVLPPTGWYPVRESN